MSRRLGDDPLNRARTERAKAAQAAAPAPSDLPGQGTTVVEVQTKSRASYNDVFFQRREAGAPQPPVPASAPEAPEITEISEIPEIHEAAAASTGQSSTEVTHVTSEEPAPAPALVPIVEQVVSKPNEAAPAEEQAPPVLAAAPLASGASATETAPEPQKTGGFFKRLFGKFK